MSLPTGQQRALDQIEKTLAYDHPALGRLFADFGRVVGREPMPVTERVTARPRARLPARPRQARAGSTPAEQNWHHVSHANMVVKRRDGRRGALIRDIVDNRCS